MKSLKPSHREKKRYLLITGKYATFSVVEAALLKFGGVRGSAEAGLQMITRGKGNVVVGIDRKMVDVIRASLAVSGKDLRVEKVSGSVKNVK